MAIKAFSKTFPEGVCVKHLINRGGWYGETYLLGIGSGFWTLFFIVEAGYEQAALETYTGSKWAWNTKITEDDARDRWGDEWEDYAYFDDGGDIHNIDDIRVLEPCEVDYFASKKDCEGLY